MSKKNPNEEVHLFGRIGLNRNARAGKKERKGKPTRQDKAAARARAGLEKRLRQVPKYSPEWHAIVRELRRTAD